MNYLCALFGFILVINFVLAEIHHEAKHPSANSFSPGSTTSKPALKQPPNTNYEFGSDDSEKYFVKYPPPVADKLTQIPKPLDDDNQNDSPSPKDYVTAALQQNHRHKKEATRKTASSFVEYTTMGTVRPMSVKNATKSSNAFTNDTFGAKKLRPPPKISEKRHAEYFPYEPTFKIKDTYYSSSDSSNYFSTQDAEHYPYETSVYQFSDENEATPSKYLEIKGKYEHKYPKVQDQPYYQSEEYLSKLKNAKQYHTTTEKPPMVIHMKPKELEKPPPHFYKPEELHEHHYPGKEYHFEPESNKLTEPNFNKPHQHSTQHEANHFPHYETSRPSEAVHRPTHPPNHYEFTPHTTPTYTSKPDTSHQNAFVVNQEGAFHQTRPSQSTNYDISYTSNQRPYLKEAHDRPHPEMFVPHKETDHQDYHFEPVKQKPKQKPQEPPNYPSLYHENPLKTESYLRPPKEPVTPEPEEETTIYVKVKNKNPEHQNRKPTVRPSPLGTTVDSITINPSYYYKPKLCEAFADYELVRKGHGYEAQKKSKRESKRATKKSEEIYEQDEATDKQFFMMPEPQALVQQNSYTGDMNTEDSKNHKFVVVYHHEQKDQKKKMPRKPEDQKLVHTHTHYHNEPEKDYEETHEHITHNYPTEYTEEHQPEVVFHYEGDQSPMGSNSIKVVDPGRSSQVEVTREDYMRHIKLAAMKYLKEMEDSFGGKNNYYRQEAPIQDINNIPYGKQTSGDNYFQSSKRIPIAISTPASFRAPFPQPTEYNLAASAKVPKNTFSAGKPLKNAISGLQNTLGQNANPIYRPFKSIDIGQNLEPAFDHTAVLRNLQGFDMSNVVNNPQYAVSSKPRLHFNKQTYHDINSLMHKDFPPQAGFQLNDKGYNSYLESQPASFTSIHGNSANVGASISFGQKINQNKVYGEHDSIEGPIQIINGLPITNPYNIDVKTLRYMLGGLAQAEVDDHLKEYNHGAIKVKPKLQGHTPLQQFPANSPILAAMEQSLNNLKNGNPNKNFNSNDGNGFVNNPKFNNNGKNRNVRDSMDNSADYSEDVANWSSSKISKSTTNKNKEGATNSIITNSGKTSAKNIAKDLIANASNLAPGQYIVRPVKKPQSKNSIFPFIFSRRSEEIMSDLRPPPANQRSDEAVATTAVDVAT